MNSVRKVLPAEWHPQKFVMLTWPHEYGWAGILKEIDATFVEITQNLVARVEVIITATNENHKKHITHLLKTKNLPLNRIHIYIAPSQDVWVRDHGPITILAGDECTLLKFTFNGWGNKYPADQDNLIVPRLYQQGAFGKLPLKTIDFAFEGGGIESDGQGTLMLTREWLTARHPHLSMEEFEAKLKEYFDALHILWVEHGYLAGDDTDSHIDTLARFIDANTIAYVTCDDFSDEHYEALQKMEKILKDFRTADGRHYKLVPLPWVKPVYSESQKKRLPASYANFLITNGAVLVPTYDDAADKKALEVLQEAFVDRKIIPIHCRYLIEYYGSLHCATMQIPM